MAKVINGQVRSYCTEEESNKKKKEEDIMADESDKSNDVLLESLRVNLEKVQKEKMELESKETEINNQIDKITQGE